MYSIKNLDIYVGSWMEHKFFIWSLALEIPYFHDSDAVGAAQLLTSAF